MSESEIWKLKLLIIEIAAEHSEICKVKLLVIEIAAEHSANRDVKLLMIAAEHYETIVNILRNGKNTRRPLKVVSY